MQLTRRSGLKLALAPLALAILGPSAVRADAGIGAVSEIDNELWGTVTGAARQALGVSAQVFRKQRLETGDDSAAVVKFIDQSQLSLGENANLVVDEYVYAGAKSRSAARKSRANSAPSGLTAATSVMRRKS
jgi:ABC-type sugar transport system substrate-binding protein